MARNTTEVNILIGNRPISGTIEERSLGSLKISTKFKGVEGAKSTGSPFTLFPAILLKEKSGTEILLNGKFVQSAISNTLLTEGDKIQVFVISAKDMDERTKMAINLQFNEIHDVEFWGQSKGIMDAVYSESEQARVFSEFFLHRPVAAGKKPNIKDPEVMAVCNVSVARSTWGNWKEDNGWADPKKGSPKLTDDEREAKRIWDGCRRAPEVAHIDVPTFYQIRRMLIDKYKDESSTKITRFCAYLKSKENNEPSEIVKQVLDHIKKMEHEE